MKQPAANTFKPRRINIMQALDIQAFTYEQRNGLLPELTSALNICGGWIVDRRTLSATNMEIRLEIQLQAVLDLYASVIAAGVEITRAGHDSLTELCSRRGHMTAAGDLAQVVDIRLEISFLEDVTLHSLMACSAGLA